MRLPNNQLYTFNDNIVFNGEQYPLSDKQAVLRGCTLRIIVWAMVLLFTQEKKRS